MDATIEILRGELERLYTLDELTEMSKRLLGLDPEDVGGSSAKASFARALAERCHDDDRIEALVDVIVVSRREVDPRVRDVAALTLGSEIAPGKPIGPFTVQKKLGEGEIGVVYLAQRNAKSFVVKVLRRDASRDRRAVARYLTATRLVSGVTHEGLPAGIEARELPDGTDYVAYEFVEAQSLAARFARTGPSHINELKPILRGIVEPLAALHKEQLVHGNLKLENVLVSRVAGQAGPQALKVTLVDFGTDRLRQRSIGANGHSGLLAVFGSKKTIAPELVRGRPADARSDVYAFGAMLYELVSGKPVFPTDHPAEAAFHHLSKEPEAPSAKAPRGWVTKEIDTFILSLLQKDPTARPKDAQSLLETVETLGRAAQSASRTPSISPEKVEGLVDLLIAAPEDAETALALEKAVDEGADAAKIAEAFLVAAGEISGEGDEIKEVKKGLFYRAARLFEGALKDKEKAEDAYESLLEVDPSDDIAKAALEEVKKQLGKYEDVVEMLLARSQEATSGEERARAMAEIGHLYSHELDDTDQALIAYAQAVCEMPSNDEYASEVERLAGDKMERWTEVLATITERVKGEASTLAGADRAALLLRAGRWYDTKTTHHDMALLAFQEVLKADPANEKANEGLTAIYKKAQEWPSYAAILLRRADAAGTTPRGRDLRTEAAHVFETQLADERKAKDHYAHVLAEDPGHAAASEGLARIAEKTGDFRTFVGLLERRAETRRGVEKVEILAKVAEVYEDHLNDLAEATRRYESVLAIDASNVVALKGLDRIYNRMGRYQELLANLERQIEIAATPRQKINLLDRTAALYEEEFLDHAKAALALEAILQIDGSNDAALTALARHYKALSRWEDLVKLYERHASLTTDKSRLLDLHVQRARVLVDQIGSPERGMRAYEQALEVEPGHAGALEGLAHLRELTGDASAALSAIEALAAKAKTPEAQAEQWMRAGRLLEGRGDLDGAIERYKTAIEANPKDSGASAALRKAYGQRGDAASVVTLIEKELEHAEGKLAKARLYAEAARVYREKLSENDKAADAAKKASELDPTNADAFVVLGDLAFEGQRYVEASKLYESLIGRTQILAQAEAVRVLTRYVEAFSKAFGSRISSPSLTDVSASSAPPASHPRVTAAVEALHKLAPDDPNVLRDVARVLFDYGDPSAARTAYADYLAKAEGKISTAERGTALYRMGESARKSGAHDAAIAPLLEAAELDPGSALPLAALSRIYEEQGKWDDAVRVKNRRLEIASGAERFDLLLEVGDIELQKIGDRRRAQRTFALALEERPDDRKILTRLMQLYSEEKDWAKLVEVVLRLADFVEDKKQRAKYLHTAAIVSARQLGEVDQALDFYDRALELDPLLDKAVDEAIDLKRTRGDHAGVEKLLNTQIEQAKEANDREKLTRVLDQLGELYLKFLNEPSLAVDAYEAAQAFDPDDRPRAELLAELYASNVEEYLDKAVHAQSQILKRSPYRVESYKLLRRLYTEAKRGDSAWCLCQALTTLNLAEPDEERFYKRHRADNAAPAQAALDENDWTSIAHDDLDPLVTRIFALIQPTIIRTRTQPLEAMGYDQRYAIDLSLHPYPVSQTLYYAHGVLGMQPPLVFQNPNDGSGLGFLHARTPGIVLGRAAFESQVPTQSLAFVAGRHLTYFRPGYYVRHLVPTGTGLKAWLFAAIKLSAPQFPIAPDLEGQVQEAMDAMNADFQGVQKELLASQVSKLLQSGTTIDLKQWVASIDHTADRAGFILSHDLGIATEVMRATEDASSIGSKERIKEVTLFGVSEAYMAIRQKLSIAIDS
jgi:tetratricopeptide (TPR) repeat protein/tRNA A-37 threonylcarbamoyl transferase component Bud32